MAAWEALVPFFDHRRVAVADGSSSHVVVLLVAEENSSRLGLHDTEPALLDLNEAAAALGPDQ